MLALLLALAFARVEIDPAPPKDPWIKVAGDFNGDGRLDLAVGGARGPLVWYAAPGWKKSLIAEGGYESVDGEAGDIDGDGDLDLVIGGVLWYQNPHPRLTPWQAHRIATHRTHDVEIGDLNRDGRLDVVVRGQTGFGHKLGHRVMIFFQGGPHDWSTREVIACPDGEGLQLADMDRDGDLDVVIAARWYENGRSWTEHVYAPQWTHGDAKVAAGDLDRDGRPDVVLSPAESKGGSYRLAWYSRGKEHIVEERIESVMHALAVADMNGDGRPDIVAARMHQGAPPQEVAVYLAPGWRKYVVSTSGSHNILALDLDGDGSMDIVGANHGGPHQPLEWWRGQ